MYQHKYGHIYYFCGIVWQTWIFMLRFPMVLATDYRIFRQWYQLPSSHDHLQDFRCNIFWKK